MNTLLDRMREEIFQYNLINFTDYLSEVYEIIQSKLILLDDEEKNMVMNTNSLIQEALHNGDYLLTTDLLKYVIGPILDKKEH